MKSSSRLHARHSATRKSSLASFPGEINKTAWPSGWRVFWHYNGVSDKVNISTGWVSTSFDILGPVATGETPTREAQRSFGSRSPRLRWQWQGLLWTSVAPLAIFVGLGPYSGDVLRDPAFELNCFLTRSV